ncbi:hypothetical protein Pfo_028226 [Paulownia fortunei]|nr:hypothetical protein Pfo_028226 [Paulownia fortunei]
MPIDRLSALPDSLLIRILSFLDMQEAAMTSVLSKRWQFLWTDLPRLEFWESSSQTEKIRKFVARVHRTLVICSGNHLENFEVDFMYDKCFASDVNVWVEFAVKNKVKDIALLLKSYKDLYVLPQMMYSNSSLRWLSVRGCVMAPRRTIEWGSLTRLYLEKVELHQRVIEKILTGCPVLYDLILKACWGFHCLMIDSKCLHELTITDRKEGNVESLLEISAPYIHSLWISLYPKGRKLRLTNISSIVRAGIDFNGFDCDAGSVNAMSYTKELFENLQHVKKLELGRGCIVVLSILAVKGWQLPQSTRGYLIVNASRDKQSIPGIVGLLESSPKLETLVVNGSYDDPYEASATCSPAASCLKKGDLNCDLLHLRTINITSFADPDLAGEPMLTLVQLLLKRAKVLEEMVIDVEEFTTFSSKHASSDYIKIAQTLLSYPRSSQKAVVLLR